MSESNKQILRDRIKKDIENRKKLKKRVKSEFPRHEIIIGFSDIPSSFFSNKMSNPFFFDSISRNFNPDENLYYFQGDSGLEADEIDDVLIEFEKEGYKTEYWEGQTSINVTISWDPNETN